MSHSPAHGCVLHGRTSRNLPRQPLPPCEGRGSEQSRFLICLPPPHCRVQVSQDFHLDHAPSTSKAIKSKVRGCSLAGVLWLEIEWNGVHHQGISRFFFFFYILPAGTGDVLRFLYPRMTVSLLWQILQSDPLPYSSTKHKQFCQTFGHKENTKKCV